MTSRKYYIVTVINENNIMSVWGTYLNKEIADNAIEYINSNYPLTKVWIQEVDVQEPTPPILKTVYLLMRKDMDGYVCVHYNSTYKGSAEKIREANKDTYPGSIYWIEEFTTTIPNMAEEQTT